MTRPITRTIPTRDRAFARLVERVVSEAHFETPDDLTGHLRRMLPRVVVRDRGLAGEGTVWYVYRDGRWQDDLSDPWWQDPRVPTIACTLDGWIVEADPMASSILGMDPARREARHFTDFVAPGTLRDAQRLFDIVASGQTFSGTVVAAPAGGELIAIELHIVRDGDRVVARMRLADDVDVPAAPAPVVPRLVTLPAGDRVFAEYAAVAVGRMSEPTPDGLALRLRRLYPHARVEVGEGHWTVHRDRHDELGGADAWWTEETLPRLRYDDEGLILDANDAARGLFDRELVGQHWQDIITPGTSQEVKPVLDMIRAAGVATSRFRVPVRAGSLIEFDSHTTWDGASFVTVMRPRGEDERAIS